MSTTWTAGVVGLGDPGEPSTTRTRPDLCAGLDHPPVTYNPWLDKTWCLCGQVVRDGDCHVHGIACCNGPLTEEMNVARLSQGVLDFEEPA